MKDKLMKFLRDEDGLTAVEYAVAGSLVAAIVVGGFTLLGGAVDGVINFLAGAIVVP
jgi:pilus assembly protein Flp/PilA